jgi:hypothetical protein
VNLGAAGIVDVSLPFISQIAEDCNAGTTTPRGIVIVPGITAAILLHDVPVPGGPAAQPTVSVAAPAPTATPVVLAAPVVIPQVFQNPGVGGIFNGPRNAPTPRPQAVAPLIVDPNALAPGGVVLRPPSTGDAGLAP